MRTSFRLWLCAGVIFAVPPCYLMADESTSATAPEALLKPWTEAVERFQKSRAGAAETLARLLEAAEEKARAAGDLDKVDLIKRERDAFEQAGTLPTIVKATAYTKSIEAAKTVLKNAAQKSKVGLVRQKFDSEAKEIDQQLANLLDGNSHSSSTTEVVGSHRSYWVEQRKDGNEFRLIKPREWVETTHDGVKTRYFWREIGRTPDQVELYDEKRNLGIRLKAGANERADNYKPSGDKIFSKGVDGDWVEPPKDVIYLSDLNELSHQVLVFNNTPGYGWGKAGQMMGKDDKWELIYLANRPSPKGIFTHPQAKGFAMVDYDIGPLRKQVFRAQFGIADAKSSDSSSPLTFVVLGDGKRLFTSKPTQKWGIASDCEVNIRDVKHLELRVECPGSDPGWAYAVWYEPRVSGK